MPRTAQGAPGQAQLAAPGPGGSGRPGGPGGGRVAPVETAPAALGTISRIVNVSGVVEPIRSIGVNSQLAGAVLVVGVEEGSTVRAGQLLARMDDRELRAQTASAEASHNMARAAYERAKQLYERQLITLAEFERDRAGFAAAEAQLDQARTRLGYATVRAPSAGVVTEKSVEAGDVVGTQSRLFTVADLSTMVVRVQVSELDVVHLRPGDVAEVVLDAIPGQRLAGRIRRVFPAADPATRLVPVEVALAGEGARVVRPGFLARVSFSLSPRDGVLLVPASALVGTAGNEAVFVIEDDKAVRRPVRTGATSRGQVEIVGGLEAGERVVSAGVNTLRDGMAVRDVNRAGATSNSGGGE